jgi:hypothetical protein
MHRRQFSSIGGMGKSIFSGSKHKGQVIQFAAGSQGMHSLQWTTPKKYVDLNCENSSFKDAEENGQSNMLQQEKVMLDSGRR